MSLGKIVKTLNVAKNNPRNSEGAFFTFDDGKIIFIYSRYKGNSFHDHASCDLYKIVSNDGGETFSDESCVFSCEDVGGTNIMSVSLIGLKNGNVGLFFVRKIGDRSNTVMMSQSPDGNVWSKPKRILNDEGYFVLNNDRIIRLQDGRLVFPVAYHQVHDVDSKNGKKTVFEPGIVYIYGSDDDENFYRLSWGYSLNNCPSGLQEPLLIQHKNGKIECYSRTDNRCQYKMIAKNDSLLMWSFPKKTCFDGPCAPMSMKYIGDNLIVAIWSNYPNKDEWDLFLKNGTITYYRVNYVIAYSVDGGKTFSDPITLEHDFDRGFCYCAIEKVHDSILLAYCSGGKDEGCCLARTSIRKIPIKDILNA